MKSPVLAVLIAAALLAACSRSTPPAVAAAPSTSAAVPRPAGIAWHQASSDADVDAAFAQAKREAKPLFLYWGAQWCPPCNQVKATLFNRQDFIERSRAFVPVYIDGDSPGAQKLGARFKVGGYPTMLLFSPQGVEMTRLPGEVEPQRYAEVLTLGMNAQRPVREVLALAQAGGHGLSASDWRLLAFYSWDTDQQQLVAKDGVAPLLARLADACPPGLRDAETRLRLKALAAAGRDERAQPAPQPAMRAAVQWVLADVPAARAQMDVLANNAAEIVRALAAPGTPQRADLVREMDGTLARFQADASLSRADRIGALTARVDLAKMDAGAAAKGAAAAPPRLPESLIADARALSAQADRETTDGYERQAVVTAAAYLLEDAGLSAESDALLQANLAKSHSPYYLMSELAGNARKRGDAAEALRWYARAFDASEGPATRLQWGASYLGALVDLAPQDEARIEQTAARLFAEAAKQPDALYERSGRSLQRAGAKLAAWSARGGHGAAMGRLRTQLDGVCAAAGDEARRADCARLLQPSPGRGPAA
jgi:thioredoxin-related protein